MKLIITRKHFEMTASALTGLSAMIFEEYASERNKDEFMIELFATGKIAEKEDSIAFINRAVEVTYNKNTSEVTIEVDPEKVDIFYDTINENMSGIKLVLSMAKNIGFAYISVLEKVVTTIRNKFTTVAERKIREKELAEKGIKINEIMKFIKDEDNEIKLGEALGLRPEESLRIREGELCITENRKGILMRYIIEVDMAYNAMLNLNEKSLDDDDDIMDFDDFLASELTKDENEELKK